VLGIKGGWTTAAGQCLLFEASRGGTSLIGVVLGERSIRSMVSDGDRLLDWGFARIPPPRRPVPRAPRGPNPALATSAPPAPVPSTAAPAATTTSSMGPYPLARP
jgi:D-alanyl-D-alanine carboxypeptidase